MTPKSSPSPPFLKGDTKGDTAPSRSVTLTPHGLLDLKETRRRKPHIHTHTQKVFRCRYICNVYCLFKS